MYTYISNALYYVLELLSLFRLLLLLVQLGLCVVCLVRVKSASRVSHSRAVSSRTPLLGLFWYNAQHVLAVSQWWRLVIGIGIGALGTRLKEWTRWLQGPASSSLYICFIGIVVVASSWVRRGRSVRCITRRTSAANTESPSNYT